MSKESYASGLRFRTVVCGLEPCVPAVQAMHGAMSEPCTAYLAWKLDRGSQTSDHFQMILKTSQMLNLNMELLDHYIGSLKKFREKCGMCALYYVNTISLVFPHQTQTHLRFRTVCKIQERKSDLYKIKFWRLENCIKISVISILSVE